MTPDDGRGIAGTGGTTRRRVLGGLRAVAATPVVGSVRADSGRRVGERSTGTGSRFPERVDRTESADPRYRAPKTNDAPTIDGTPERLWEDVPAESCEHVVSGSRDGPADVAADWRAVWDADAFYVFVAVTDDSLVNDSETTWKDDSVELYVDGDHSGGDAYDGDDYELMFDYEDPTVVTGVNSATDTAGMEFATTSASDGWTCEIALPLETIGVAPGYGEIFGLDVHVNDDDTGGERDGKLSWHATTDDAWKYPSRFADVALGTAAVGADPAPPAPTDLSTSDRSGNSVDVSWEAPTEGASVDHYAVYLDGWEDHAVDADVAATTLDGQVGDGSVTVHVTAVDAAGRESDAAGPLHVAFESATEPSAARTTTSERSSPSPDDEPTDANGPTPGFPGAIAGLLTAGWAAARYR